MLGLIAAAVAIDDKTGSAFGEGAAESIDAGDDERDGLDDARAAPLAKLGRGIHCAFCRHFGSLVR